VGLGHIDQAHALMGEVPPEDADATDTQAKWKRLGDSALRANNFALAEAAAVASDDFSGLLLLYSATGNMEGMRRLSEDAAKGGKTNIAFVAGLLTGKVEECVDLLVDTKRLPEAAFFSRTFLPSRVKDTVDIWRGDLSKTSETAAKALADPSTNPDLFPDYDIALQVEQMFLAQRDAVASTGIPASDYLTAKDDLDLELIELIKTQMTAAPPMEPEAVVEVVRTEEDIVRVTHDMATMGTDDPVAEEEKLQEDDAVEDSMAPVETVVEAERGVETVVEAEPVVKTESPVADIEPEMEEEPALEPDPVPEPAEEKDVDEGEDDEFGEDWD